MLEMFGISWNSFWFTPGSAFDLGVARFFVVGYYLVFKLTERPFDFQAWAKVYRIFSKVYPWQTPWLLKKMNISVEPNKFHSVIIQAYVFALIMTMLGLLTTAACFIALVLGLYLHGLRHGIRNHHTGIPIHFCLLGFLFSQSGKAFSLDSFISGNFNFDLLHYSAWHGWGLIYIKVVMALVIFATGYAKIKQIPGGHIFWKKGHLADLTRVHDFPFFFVAPIFSMSRFFRKFPNIEVILSLGTVVIEVLYPIVLFFPLTAWFFVPNFVAMLIGFRIFIGARFDFFAAILVGIYVPWSWFL